MSALAVALGLASLLLAAMSGYLLLLTAAAVLARRRPPPPGPGRLRFAILVPAHDEESVLGRLLESLAALDYPRTRYDVFVVADNCADATAWLAGSHGATVYERSGGPRGKGAALRWLLDHIAAHRRADDEEELATRSNASPARPRRAAEAAPYDAYIVVDADTTVQPNLLRAMEGRLAAGGKVVQAYYTVLNASQSWLAALRMAALASLHYLRPLGRASLGLSCGLKGNGMCFAATVLERSGWRWFELAEDVELHLALARDGVRVDFAPETHVLAEMPTSFAQSRTQHERWERGRLRLLRAEVGRLLWQAARRRDLMLLDAAVEQLIPPLSAAVSAAALCATLALVSGASVAASLATIALLGFATHVLAGMVVARVPVAAYRALLLAPLYVVWKLALYVRAAADRRGAWVRTERRPTR